MKQIKQTQPWKTLLTAMLGLAVVGGASAYEVPLTYFGSNMPPVTFHGLASQGYLYSSDYNYLADNSSQGSFQFTELGINASMNPFPNTRIAVQGYDFDVGNVGQYDPFLDYALVEYTFNDTVGIRAGRIRRPSGIYNHIQDVDLARTYVLLPQGMYDARWRDWSASLDGGELFGSIPLGKAGSLTYEVYAGMVTMTGNGGVARYIENNVIAVNPRGTFDSIDDTPTYGGQLWYNSPLDGLRFGASFYYMENWGYNIVSGVKLHAVGNIPFQQYSVEYLWKNWTFQAEYATYNFTGHFYMPTMNNRVYKATSDNPQTWYAAASYRFNKYLEVGGYYTEYHNDSSYTKYSSDNSQHDTALSFRFDIKDWWIFKVEGHYIVGTALVHDSVHNPVRNDDGWFMLAVKTTVSF